MSFVEPITIKEAVENIYRKNYLLPAIQREFVWSTDQIERLFDSLMRDYPISSFLFWAVEKENVQNFQFYEFLQHYHERDAIHNPKADPNGQNGITAILDGQQRLTSLLIGLKGTYTYKLPRKRWDNNTAFPKRKLCLNLVKKSDESDLVFDFRFLTKKEYENNNQDCYWYVVGEILDIDEPYLVNDFVIDKISSKYSQEKFRFANKTLFKLHDIIHKVKSINFFLEKDKSLDKVLNIFIRVNSGGTKLSYSDLLLSIATAQWKLRDAREEITLFVDEINSLGEGFNINKDFVLKSCLVLGGFKEIAFKVDNFNKENMLHIESEWENISKAIKSAFILLSTCGYHRDSLTSNNAIIPIAYYLKKIGSPNNFSDSSKYEKDRVKIIKWLVIVLLKKTFSGQSDNVLRSMRDVLIGSSNNFPFEEIQQKLKGTNKALSFDDDEIDNLMYYQYAESYTYSVLSFLYPSLDFRNRFHQDHIYPKKLFTSARLKKRGINDERQEFYINNFNYLANIQLLEGLPNQEKSSKDFGEWLLNTYPEKGKRKEYMKKHYIPDVDLSLDNFKEFIEGRTALMIAEFKSLVA